MTQPYHVWPDISIDGTLLSRQIDSQLEQVVVDDHQHLPDKFALPETSSASSTSRSVRPS